MKEQATPDEGDPVRMFVTLGRWCARRPKRVVAAWLLLLVGLAAAVGVLGSATTETVSIPGSDSQAAHDAARAFADSASGRQPLVLYTPPDGPPLTSGPARDAVQEAARALAARDHVLAVTTPYEPAGRAALAPDGHTAYLAVELDLAGRDITADVVHDLMDAAEPAEAAGIEVTPGGNLAEAADKKSTRRSEIIGLVAAFAVLCLGFRKPIAAAVPLATAVVGLGISLEVIGLTGHLTDMPSSGATIAAMIGLGVGIDYSLFCLTRFRELLATGKQFEDAAALTIGASGKAVAFAGTAVIAALAGLALGGLPLLRALALAPGIAVLVAMAATLTLLPALFGLLGRRLAPAPVAADEPQTSPPPARGWARIARHVADRPWRYLLSGLAFFVLPALAAAQLSFGQLDGGDKSPGTAGRTAYDRLASAFGPGVNGPLQVTSALPKPASGPADPDVTSVGEALKDTSGVAAVGPAQLSRDGRTVRWQVTPTTAPGDPRTAALVHRLRERTLPPVTQATGSQAHVGGIPATQLDLGDRLAERLPAVIGVVLAIAGLLLLLAFRSPLVAVKAAVLNLLSVAAAYGVLTALFQWGWGATPLGLDGPVPIPGYVPLLMFAVLFGLSMDYEVFLLSAVREAWLATGDNRGAVITGLARTGRIITSAALIMVCVFLGYLLWDDPVVKMFGIGLATAVALDATVVRGLLVPTTMVLFGKANWWLPSWLDRLLPQMHIEGGEEDIVRTSSSVPEPVRNT
ncbi:MMPL family transporter [Streptomyces sp. NBC_01006]|uniref:MMPL family transporter n=1 Tax=Streptomyces sp. NBC_01006 TaxID=2903716 RepID=UPI0038708F30|nr:MMPL family transporter [Streptomyces sp. NBC_01006]